MEPVSFEPFVAITRVPVKLAMAVIATFRSINKLISFLNKVAVVGAERIGRAFVCSSGAWVMVDFLTIKPIALVALVASAAVRKGFTPFMVLGGV